jgi:uncharacterized cupin superfamily protein
MAAMDEFAYVLTGHPTLVTDAGETQLQPGRCTGFPAGTGNAQTIVNRTDKDCTYLLVGDRSRGDALVFPDDALVAVPAPDGTRRRAHKDGTPYAWPPLSASRERPRLRSLRRTRWQPYRAGSAPARRGLP